MRESRAFTTLHVGDEPITVKAVAPGVLLHIGQHGIYLGDVTATNRVEVALREARMLLRGETT